MHTDTNIYKNFQLFTTWGGQKKTKVIGGGGGGGRVKKKTKGIKFFNQTLAFWGCPILQAHVNQQF